MPFEGPMNMDPALGMALLAYRLPKPHRVPTAIQGGCESVGCCRGWGRSLSRGRMRKTANSQVRVFFR